MIVGVQKFPVGSRVGYESEKGLIQLLELYKLFNGLGYKRMQFISSEILK